MDYYEKYGRRLSLFKYWLIVGFACYCLGDAGAFYEKQEVFAVCIGVAVFQSILCLCSFFLKRYRITRWDTLLFTDLRNNLCILLSVLMAISGFINANSRIKIKTQWQSLSGRQIAVQ